MALKRPRSSSTMTNYSPRPRNSDLFSNASPLATKDNLFSISKNIRKGQNNKTLDLIEQKEGHRTVRLYQTFELYFEPTDIEKGKQFCIKKIRNDNIYGLEFGKLGIGKGWLLTKIGNDVNATKFLFAVTRNKLLNLAKLAKKSGYQLTFEGNELNQIIEEKNDQNEHKNENNIPINVHQDANNKSNKNIINTAHINRHFIDDTDDLPAIPQINNNEIHQIEGVNETNHNVPNPNISIEDDDELPMLPDNNNNNNNNNMNNDKDADHFKIQIN